MGARGEPAGTKGDHGKDAFDHYIFIHSFLIEKSMDFGNSTESHPHGTVQKNTGANCGFPVHNSE